MSQTKLRTYPDVSLPVGTRPKLQPLRLLTVLIIVVVVVDFAVGVVRNDRLAWDVVAEYIFSPDIISGLGVTLWLTVVSMVLGTALGGVLAVMALSNDPILRGVAALYVLVFRSVPQLVQLLFWYFLAAIVPFISIGLPFGIDIVTLDSTKLITQMAAALLGLSLAEAAYLAEYFRAGITSVPTGQTEAAMACGMTPNKKFWRIVVPQAIRIVIPSYGNSFISLLKGTSIVFVIGAGELLTRAQLIYSQNYQQIPLLIVVSIWYVFLVVLMTLVQRRIEARYSRGYSALTTTTASQ